MITIKQLKEAPRGAGWSISADLWPTLWAYPIPCPDSYSLSAHLIWMLDVEPGKALSEESRLIRPQLIVSTHRHLHDSQSHSTRAVITLTEELSLEILGEPATRLPSRYPREFDHALALEIKELR